MHIRFCEMRFLYGLSSSSIKFNSVTLSLGGKEPVILFLGSHKLIVSAKLNKTTVLNHRDLTCSHCA